MDKKDIKLFAFIGGIVINTVVTIVIGILLGKALDYLFSKNIFAVIFPVCFTFIAIVNFFVQIWKLAKIRDQKNK